MTMTSKLAIMTMLDQAKMITWQPSGSRHVVWTKLVCAPNQVASSTMNSQQ